MHTVVENQVSTHERKQTKTDGKPTMFECMHSLPGLPQKGRSTLAIPMWLFHVPSLSSLPVHQMRASPFRRRLASLSLIVLTLRFWIGLELVDENAALVRYNGGVTNTTAARGSSNSTSSSKRGNIPQIEDNANNDVAVLRDASIENDEERRNNLPPESLTTQLNLERNNSRAEDEDLAVIHRAVSGLGHRLGRMAAAYHLTKALNISHLYASWGWECGTNENGDPDVFDNLFGRGPMIVPSPLVPLFPSWHVSFQRKNNTKNDTKQMVKFINRIPGYRRAQAQGVDIDEVIKNNYYGKQSTDREFYSQLMALFRYRGQAVEFMKRHRFTDHTVVGLHIRAGNGEHGHFQRKHREINISDEWVHVVAQTIHEFSQNWTKPAMIFVASDTFGVIDKLAQAMKPIPVISFDQTRMQEGRGVSFNHKWNETNACHADWVSQFTDMMLLSLSDIVVAASYSSFPQTMPLAMMLLSNATRNQEPANQSTRSTDTTEHYTDPHSLYCELDRSGHGMACFADFSQWIMKGHAILIGNATNSRLQDQTDTELAKRTILHDVQRAFNGTILEISEKTEQNAGRRIH